MWFNGIQQGIPREGPEPRQGRRHRHGRRPRGRRRAVLRHLQVRIHGMARPLGSDEKDAPNFEDFPYDAVVAFEMVQERE